MSRLLLVAAIYSSLCHPAQARSLADFIDGLLPRPELQVVTVTDVTPAGAGRVAASPNQPVYYMASSTGYRELGAIVAGQRVPDQREVTRTMIKVLAKQGYLPATSENPPSVVLCWMWGTFNAQYLNFTGDYSFQSNHGQLLAFLGGAKLGLGRPGMLAFDTELPAGLLVKSAAAEALGTAARDHLYVARVAAYDLEAARNGNVVLLWTTKISAPARGFWLPEVLPSMLVIAGPFLGRETTEPVWVDATEKFRPEVILGDPRFVDYAEQGEGVVIDSVPNEDR